MSAKKKAKKTTQKSAATLGKRRLRIRAAGCALRVLECLQNIPFEKLATAVFLFARDLNTEQFVHKYEAQIELAGANPERFSAELFDFFSQMADRIRGENLYQEYFEFLGLCAKLHAAEKSNTVRERVTNAYLSLLLQQLEHLRPSQYDFSSVVCGITTSGEVMTIPDFCPEFDLLAMELKAWEREQAKKTNTLATGAKYTEAIHQIFGKWGYTVNSLADLEHISAIDDIFSTHHGVMAQYINEYTYDMLPDAKNAFTSFALPFYSIEMPGWSSDDLVAKLKKRARTLPTNGATVVFSYNDVLKIEKEPHLIDKIRMKEILYEDRVIMLYRLWTCEGELCGYYDTKDGFLFSIFLNVTDRSLYERVKAFILYFYAALVTRDGTTLVASAGKDTAQIRSMFSKEIISYETQIFGEHGRLHNTYKDVVASVNSGHGKLRTSDPAYIGEVRAIQGFIRKVGEGRKPSAEAVARAESLGYDLAPDETYVQGFFKTVFKLRER